MSLILGPLGCGKSGGEPGPAAADTSGTDGGGTDGGGTDGGGTDGGTSGTDADPCAGTAYAGDPLCVSWMLNTTGETSAVLRDSSGGALPVNVQSVSYVAEDDSVEIRSAGIPSYVTEVDQALLDALNSRPNKATDFVSGGPALAVGDVVEFGQDVGYSSNSSCQSGGGYGYWPPGPVCPDDAGVELRFPLSPTPAATGEECVTGLDTVGLFVNGVALFNWSDGFSYDALGVWQNLAQKFEVYDGGICDGHAAGVTYHHHSSAACLGDQLGDDGSGHSPIYGFAGDGYPIHGPWYADGVRAESCWKTRDYDSASDLLGCGGGGVRDCLLVDSLDPTQGVIDAAAQGPNTSDEITSLSGNVFTAVSGFYLQDWYFDPSCAEAGGATLDAHNGHDHDGLGYHYHVTDSFPYFVGPTLAGETDGTQFPCDGVSSGGGGGPPP